MNKAFASFGRIFLRIVEMVVGASFFLMGIGLISSGVPTMGEKAWSGLELASFVSWGGAIILFGAGLLIILRGPRNPLLHFISGLLLLLPTVSYCSLTLTPVIRGEAIPSSVLLVFSSFGLVFLAALVICFSRAYLFWRQKKSPKKGGDS